MTTHRRVGQPRVYVWPAGSVTDRIDLSGDVMAFNASRDLENPAGSWSITLLPRTGELQTPGDIRRALVLYNLLRPNMVLSLGHEEDGGIGLGLIGNVTRTRQWSGQSVSVALTITGSWLGKVLTQDAVKYSTIAVQEFPRFASKIAAVVGENNPLIKAFAGAWGPPEPGAENSRDAVPTFLGQSVDVVVDWILANAPSMRLPLFAGITGGTGSPADYISTDFSVTSWHDDRLWSDALSSYQGSVWGFLTSVVDADFYEVFLEYVPTGAALPSVQLVIRPKPFDEPGMEFAPVDEQPGLTWDTLRTLCDGLENHVIGFSEVFSESFGFGDAQAFSFYKVTSAFELIGNPESEKEGLAYPLVDTWALPMYGVREYGATLSLLAGDVVAKAQGLQDADGEIRGEVREARNRLFNWYRLSPYFEGGTTEVLGRDRFRPGDPVLLPWQTPAFGEETGVRYYMTGVSWSWSFGGHYTSTLQLTRGHNAGVVRWAKEQIAASAPPDNPQHFADV